VLNITVLWLFALSTKIGFYGRLSISQGHSTFPSRMPCCILWEFTFNVFNMKACGGGDAMFLSLAPVGECWMMESECIQKIIEYRGANIA
jgi:hypothetical protein